MIDNFSFGTMTVKGCTYTSDIKIIRREVISDWWRKRGHMVDVEDVQDILAARPDILILGRGEPGRMRVTDALRDRLEKSGIELIVENTREAAETFNRLIEKGASVAAGFHLGC